MSSAEMTLDIPAVRAAGSSIATKLVDAMKAVDAVTKRGRNDQQKYAYVKATDVANEVRKALADAGIAFTYSVISERPWESQTKSGTTMFFCSLVIEVTFVDSETGELMKCNAIGWGADMQDKAPYKAMTGALKYALRMNFLIPDESDPEEGEAHESVPQTPPPYQQQRASQPSRSPVQTISEPQSKRFFAMAKQGNKSNDDIRHYLMDVCKCERSLEMPRDKYEAACRWAESEPLPPTLRPDPAEITDDDIPF